MDGFGQSHNRRSDETNTTPWSTVDAGITKHPMEHGDPMEESAV
jgi:hypothetical protein